MTIRLSPQVAEALQDGRGVVALESAVLTCGLPKRPWNPAHGLCPDEIDAHTPLHLAVCRAMVQAVRDTGAQPALCGVLQGEARIGLSTSELTQLAQASSKAAPDTLALHVARGTSAGTTVGGTLSLIKAASDLPDMPPIRVFATGGIGGVHRGWQSHPDISADLAMLSRVPCAVVCAGGKSLLDGPATYEALQSLGVPVFGIDCDRLPAFTAAGSEDSPQIERLNGSANELMEAHFSLGGGGMLFVQNPPGASALDPLESHALAEAAEQAVSETGAARTPALLDWMARSSNGDTLRANIALLLANAAKAGAIAAG
ncbi:MAG: pseudouridine-5'-phosphate glycosidase [Phycisphaerales bacterium]|nr:pseudouridine-5'-phosphate glycosidase [Phycisphaerales bacterium]